MHIITCPSYPTRSARQCCGRTPSASWSPAALCCLAPLPSTCIAMCEHSIKVIPQIYHCPGPLLHQTTMPPGSFYPCAGLVNRRRALLCSSGGRAASHAVEGVSPATITSHAAVWSKISACSPKYTMAFAVGPSRDCPQNEGSSKGICTLRHITAGKEQPGGGCAGGVGRARRSATWHRRFSDETMSIPRKA